MTHNIGESSSAALSTITIGASQESCPRGGDDDEAAALHQGQSQPKMETGLNYCTRGFLALENNDEQ